MAYKVPSGPFTFTLTSGTQLSSEDLSEVPDTFSFDPVCVGSKGFHRQKAMSSMAASSLATSWGFTTALPLLLIYSAIGRLVFIPVCAQLVLYLITEVVDIAARIFSNLALLSASEARKSEAIVKLEEANHGISVLQEIQRVANEQLQTATRKITAEKAISLTNIRGKDGEIERLRHDLSSARTETASLGTNLRQHVTKLQSEIEVMREEAATTQMKLQHSITTALSEKCIARDAHDKEIAALKAIMKKDQAQVMQRQISLRQTLAEQARADGVRIEQLNITKTELAQAQNELLRTRYPPPPSPVYHIESRPPPVPRAFPRTSSHLPEELMTLDPLSSGFTCIGTTKKGLRCKQFMISNSAKHAANERLQIMRSNNPENTFELPQLKKLASWMLCPRWHSSHAQCPQHREVASTWFRELKKARDSSAARQTLVRTPAESFSTPARPTLISSTSSSNSSRLSLSSRSSLFSVASFGSASNVATSPECSPLAKRSHGSGRSTMGY